MLRAINSHSTKQLTSLPTDPVFKEATLSMFSIAAVRAVGYFDFYLCHLSTSRCERYAGPERHDSADDTDDDV